MDDETREKANELTKKINSLKAELENVEPKDGRKHIHVGLRDYQIDFGHDNDRSNLFLTIAKSFIQSDLGALEKEFAAL